MLRSRAICSGSGGKFMAKLKDGKWEYDEDELDRQLAEATKRGEKARLTQPHARSVEYDRDSGRIVLNLEDEKTFIFPVDCVEGLVGASTEDIADVAVVGDGTALRWNTLDIDLGVPELVEDIFGTRRWMARLGQQGGRVISDRKTLAARENGKKGGRPPSPVLFVNTRAANMSSAKCTIASKSAHSSEIAVLFERLILDLVESETLCETLEGCEVLDRGLSEYEVPLAIDSLNEIPLTLGTEADNATLAFAA